jgi:hypothetical protein
MSQEPESPSNKEQIPPLQADPEAMRREAGEIEKKRPQRLNPTRYGDWEKDGRCIDF